MRALALAVLLLTGCTGGPGASSPRASAAEVATPSVLQPTSATKPPAATPVASPAPSPQPNTTFTADDKEIARLISSGSEAAIPQLMVLNKSDPGKLEDIFLPLGAWIASQKAGLEPYSASTCTSGAVALFTEGMDRYDTIRKQFLAWRDWGANGNAFPPGAPRQAHESFDAALVELGAHCPA